MSIDGAIVTGVRDLWQQGHLQDFTIQVGDHSFKVHKLIIASVSHYFCSKLIGTKEKSAKDVIQLEGVSPLAMENLISFIYKGEMSLTEENVTEILDGAMFLQIPTAVKTCTEYMIHNTRQYYTMLSLFKKYGLTKEIQCVQDLIKKYNQVHFGCFPDGVSMTYEELCYVIDTWQYSENWLFRNVTQWVEHDKQNRMQRVNDLTSKVRFCLMTPEELGHIQEMEIYKEGFEWWHVLVTKAIDYHKLPAHQKVLNDSEQNSVRGPPSPSGIMSMYDNELANWPDHQWLRSFKDDKWRLSSEIKGVSKYFSLQQAAIVVNNFLIVKACDDRPEWSVFDPRMESWSTLAPSVERKSKSFALVHHRNHLYIVAGCKKGSSDEGEFHYSTDTIEKYDFRTNGWSSFLELPESLMCHAACVFEDNLYISGGHDYEGGKSSNRVYCYDLIRKKWKSIPNMLEPMSEHVMSVMKLKGKEIISVLSKDFQLSYFCLDRHAWTTFTVTPNLKVLDPSLEALGKLVFGGLPDLKTGNVVVNGNSVFFSDVKEDGQWRNGGICFVLTFNENGEGATVKYLPNAEEELLPVMLSVSRDEVY